MRLTLDSKKINRNLIQKNIATVLQYIQVSQGLTQEEMAKMLDLNSRTTYARIIRGEKELEYYQSFILKEKFNITSKELSIGKIFQSNLNEAQFKIPEIYKKNPFTGGRVIDLYKTLFEYFYGNEKFNQFCQNEGLDPLYFVDIRNNISIFFSMRVAQYLIQSKKICSYHQIEELGKSIFHLSPGIKLSLENYLHSQNSISKLYLFVKKAYAFERNHTYIIEDLKDDEITISFYPNEHIDLKVYKNDPILGEFFRYWIKGSLLGLSDQSLHVSEKANLYKGDSKTTFTFTKGLITNEAQNI